MTIFVIMLPEEHPAIPAAIDARFRDRSFRITSTQYLVSAERVTAAQVLEMLGGNNGALGRIVVLKITDYYGWYNKDLWEWIVAQAPTAPPTSESTGV